MLHSQVYKHQGILIRSLNINYIETLLIDQIHKYPLYASLCVVNYTNCGILSYTQDHCTGVGMTEQRNGCWEEYIFLKPQLKVNSWLSHWYVQAGEHKDKSGHAGSPVLISNIGPVPSTFHSLWPWTCGSSTSYSNVLLPLSSSTSTLGWGVALLQPIGRLLR